MKMEEIPSFFATQEKVAVPRLPLPNRFGCQDFGRLLQRQNGETTEQRQQASTPQEAPKRRLDVREDECANLTPKGFVLIDAILGLLTACFAK